MTLPPKLLGLLPKSADDRIFSHFTNAIGVEGITGIDGNTLKLYDQVYANKLQFGLGVNSFLSSESGQIFVTELGVNATDGQLMQIGVFGDKQNFVIQFSEKEAVLNNGIRIIGEMPSRSIYTISGETTLRGKFLITKIRV